MVEFSSWLDERYQYDVDARNKKVAQFCLDHFAEQQEIQIVDVGSGTGSNFINLSDKFTQNQNWIFLEQDEGLILHSLERIKREVTKRGFTINQKDDFLSFKKNSQKITLGTVNGSLLDIDKLIDLKTTDLITASAVFDLLSKEQFAAFSDQVHSKKVSVLSTLNYTGMHFEPSSDSDNQFIDLYNAHMQRAQPFGIGMGSDCYAFMDTYYTSKHIACVKGESIWNLDEAIQKMHAFLLTFMEESIAELNDYPRGLEQWIKEKRKLSAQGVLKIIVNHGDTFTYYKNE